MSQAVTIIFAEYFEIEPEVNHLSGSLANRIQDLELKVFELNNLKSNVSELQQNLFDKLKSELTNVLLKEVTGNIDELKKVLFDNPKGKLISGSQKELEQKSPSSSASEPQLKSFDNKGNKQLGLAVEDKSLDKPLSKKSPTSNKIASNDKPKSVNFPNDKDVMTITQLAKRFNCSLSLISKQKGRYKDERGKFISWSKSKDPDGYGWEFKEDSTLLYRVELLA